MQRDMNILPVELQQDILGHLCGLPTVDVNKVGQDELRARQRAPFMLATISRRWRDLCLQTPDLWSFYDSGGASDERDMAYAKLCLQRSAQAAVDAIIWCREPDIFQQHLQLLEKHQSRWRNVYLIFPLQFSLGDTIQICRRSMPRLRELRLVSVAGPARSIIDQDWSSGDTASLLPDSQRLEKFDNHIWPFVPASPLRRLTSLAYNQRGSSDARSLWDTLALTPGLEELTLFVQPHSSWATPPPETDITLPALRRMAIFGMTDGALWASRFKAPRMDTLMVSVEWCDYADALFNSPVVRQQVKHLTLSTIEPYDGGFLHHPDAAAIGELEALETLELRSLRPVTFKPRNQSFFRFLAGDIEEAPAPAWAATFRRLVIRDCRFNFAGCGTMATFVQSRLEAAKDEGGQPFEFELVNAVFVVTDGDEPDIPEIARAHFANYIENIVTVVEEPEVVAGEPEVVAEEPERLSEEPEGLAEEQEVPSQEPESPVQEPGGSAPGRDGHTEEVFVDVPV